MKTLEDFTKELIDSEFRTGRRNERLRNIILELEYKEKCAKSFLEVARIHNSMISGRRSKY